jgi:apolipoprotein N-acyltransferase
MNIPIKDTRIKLLLAVLSGILGFLAFPPFKLGLLGWVCLVPLFLAMEPEKAKQNFLYGYLAGLVFFGSLLYWLPNVTVPGAIILVLFLGVFYGVFGVISGYVLKYSMNLLFLPFMWVILEFIRGNLFTGFPWGILGYSQYENINLIQIADITGVYGVSFLMVAFNVALFSMFMRSKRKIAYMMVSLLFMIISISYGIYRLPELNTWGSARISVVQGNIPQKFKWDPGFAEEIMKEYTGFTKEAAADSPDMIIWPETAYPHLVEEDGEEAEKLNSLSREAGAPILVGFVSAEGDEYYNSAAVFDGKSERIAKYDKLHLVPFGEYVPFEERISFIRDYIDKPIGDFGRGTSYTLFPLASTRAYGSEDGALMRTTNFFKFGVLICFEDIFPYIAREFVKSGANIMVNITNDAWFGDTAAPEQHMQASVFRAVENRVPVIRAANTGVSCFIDPTGKITSRVRKGKKDVFVGGFATDNVNVLRTRTYYTVYGDIFVYFCAFMALLLIFTEGVFLGYETKSAK